MERNRFNVNRCVKYNNSQSDKWENSATELDKKLADFVKKCVGVLKIVHIFARTSPSTTRRWTFLHEILSSIQDKNTSFVKVGTQGA